MAVARGEVPAPESFLPLTSAVFSILLALEGGASHGYAIMRTAEDIPGAAPRLGPGTLYRSMQRMLVDGFIVEITDAGNEADERRRRYRLTRLGHAVAHAEAARLAALVDAAQARGLLRRGSSAARTRTSARSG